MKAKETNMKTKKSLLVIVFSLIATFAMVLGIGFIKPTAATYADEPDYGGRYITFDVTVDDASSKAIASGYAGELAVKYTVTENTGVDELQLKLDYNQTAFKLVRIETLKILTDTLSEQRYSATVTNGTATTASSENYDAYKDFTNLAETGANIVYENVNNTYTAEGDVLIIAYFTVNNPTPVTAYNFSIANINSGSEFSNAWKNVTNEENQSGTHTPVEIKLSTATVFVRGDLNLTLTGNTKTYDGIAATDAEITVANTPAFTAENKPEIDLVWFDSAYNMLTAKPVNVGTYYVSVQTVANDYWNAYCGYTGESAPYTLTKYATYTITPKAITIAFAAKEKQYKTFDNSTFAGYLTENDYCTITGLVGEETLTVSLDATNILNANVGTYVYSVNGDNTVLVTLANGANGGLVSNYSATITGTFKIKQKEIDIHTVAEFEGNSFKY
ncbi:MAG: hypothetical protein IJQ23_04535, partial [Clostridia bacterium]|nr:hypothetical protein [Clostridia bacterium]